MSGDKEGPHATSEDATDSSCVPAPPCPDLARLDNSRAPAADTALTRLATQAPVAPLPDPHGRAYAADGSDVTDLDLDLDLEPALFAAEFCPRTP
ncbi:hypothetical protein [Streptomyces phaeochromogenes]